MCFHCNYTEHQLIVVKAITTNIFSSSVLNGKGEVTLYEESSDNKEDVVKVEGKSVEKAGLIQRLTSFLATRYAFRYN